MTDSPPFEVLRVHHVAVATEGDADLADRLETLLGLTASAHAEGGGFDEIMYPAGAGYVQLLRHTGPGVVARFLERRGPGLHHIGIEVDDLDAALDWLRSHGARLVDDEPGRSGMGDRNAFVHPDTFGGVLVELIESASAS